MGLSEVLIVEHCLDEILTIIKCAVDCHCAHVWCIDRRHLPTLHLADATVRIENHDVDVVARLHSVNGGAARVAACRTNDRHAFSARAQDVIKQSTQQLQCHVLERQRRTVEQLHQIVLILQWHERHDIGMAKFSVCAPAQLKHRVGGDVPLAIGFEHRGREVGIRGAHCGQGWPTLRNVEPSVGCQTCQHRVGKIENRCRSAGRDVLHVVGAFTVITV